jgi:phosphate-selective porin
MKKLFLSAICFLLGAAVYAQEITAKYKKAFVSEAFQLYGYGQVITNFSSYTDRGMVRTAANSSIDIARIILFATGKTGERNQFGYMIMLDAGPNQAMQELYGEWTPSSAVSLRLGQYKIPFTIENPMSASRIETVYSSRSVAAMSGSVGDFNQFGGNGGVKAGRDAGLMLSGKTLAKKDFFMVEYYAGLFNGTGLNTKDNNNHKDFIATAYFQPVKGLKIGGSVYSGKISVDGSPTLSAGYYDRKAFAVGGVFDSKHFYIRSEYMANTTGNIDRQGYYASGVWKCTPDKWETVCKFDYYNSDKSIKNSATRDYTIGLNYYFAYLTKIQLNYIFTEDMLKGNNHAAAVQLQLFF